MRKREVRRGENCINIETLDLPALTVVIYLFFLFTQALLNLVLVIYNKNNASNYLVN